MTLEKYLPIWDELTKEQQDMITSQSMQKRLEKGTRLLSNDKECHGFLIVETGQLRAYITSPEGREITIYRLFDRDICLFSASCMMKNIQFEVSITAEQDTQVWVIPAPVYQSIMNSSLAVTRFTNELMASRFTDVMWVMEQVLWNSMDKRLATFLLEESTIEETDTLHMTHEQIASHLGSAREVVTRLLKSLQEEGMVRLSRGTIQILDYEKLRSLAD